MHGRVPLLPLSIYRNLPIFARLFAKAKIKKSAIQAVLPPVGIAGRNPRKTWIPNHVPVRIGAGCVNNIISGPRAG